MEIQEIQTAIQSALRNNNITEEELGFHLGLSRQGVNYLLNNASKIDLITYNSIKFFFKKKGIILNLPEEKRQRVNALVIETAALINHGLQIFHTAIENSLSIEKINENEINSLIEQLEAMKSEFSKKIDEIKGVVK